MPRETSSEWENYVELWGLRFEDIGMARSVGRIWGRLLICDPDHRSLTQLCEELDISKGTASTNTRLLEAQGLLERVAVPGSREVHYRIPPDAFGELMRRKLESTEEWRDLARRGLKLASDDVPVDRLERLHEFYAFIAERQRDVLREWEEQQTGDG